MSLLNWGGYQVTQTTMSFPTITEMFSYLRKVRIDKSLVLPSVIIVDDSIYTFDNNKERYVKQSSENRKAFLVNSLPIEQSEEIQQFQTGNDIQEVEDYIDGISGNKIRLTINTPVSWSELNLWGNTLAYIYSNFIGIMIENAGSISGTYYSYSDGDRGYNYNFQTASYIYYETIAGLTAEEFNTNFTEESNLIFLTREPGRYVIQHNLNTLQPIVRVFDSGSRDDESLEYYAPGTMTPGFIVENNNTITISTNSISNNDSNSRYIAIIVEK
jgi:hypothetical protein